MTSFIFWNKCLDAQRTINGGWVKEPQTFAGTYILYDNIHVKYVRAIYFEIWYNIHNHGNYNCTHPLTTLEGFCVYTRLRNSWAVTRTVVILILLSIIIQNRTLLDETKWVGIQWLQKSKTEDLNRYRRTLPRNIISVATGNATDLCGSRVGVYIRRT